MNANNSTTTRGKWPTNESVIGVDVRGRRWVYVGKRLNVVPRGRTITHTHTHSLSLSLSLSGIHKNTISFIGVHISSPHITCHLTASISLIIKLHPSIFTLKSFTSPSPRFWPSASRWASSAEGPDVAVIFCTWVGMNSLRCTLHYCTICCTIL